MISLPRTGFTECLIQENELGLHDADARDQDARALRAHGFDRWAFVPGMTFGAMTKWWGDRGQRETPHEGVDLCLYLDHQGDIRRLREHTRFPALYGGTVVRLCDDFLGRSVMIERDLPGQGTLYVMYGHTVPRQDLQVGQVVREGEIVASLAPLPRPRTDILSHLHISLGWAGHAVQVAQLDWAKIPDMLTLLDPMQVLGGRFQVLEPPPSIPALRAMTAAGRFCSDRSDVSTRHDDYLVDAYIA